MSLTFGVVLIILSSISLTAILKKLLLVNGFTLFIWFTLPFTYPGETIAQIGTFQMSEAGIIKALLITIKTNAALLGIIALLTTSSPVKIGHSLEKLYLPTRLCFLLLFAYRYIFVIYNEYKTLLRAAKMRCFEPDSSIHTYRTFAHLFAMTLIRSHNRAFRIHQAMALRGFDGKFISLGNDKAGLADLVFLFFFIVVLALIGYTGLSIHLS